MPDEVHQLFPWTCPSKRRKTRPARRTCVTWLDAISKQMSKLFWVIFMHLGAYEFMNRLLDNQKLDGHADNVGSSFCTQRLMLATVWCLFARRQNRRTAADDCNFTNQSSMSTNYSTHSIPHYSFPQPTPCPSPSSPSCLVCLSGRQHERSWTAIA